MTYHKLPDAAYAALDSLKKQAKASVPMDSGEIDSELLNDAQEKMKANDAWVRKIVRALLSSKSEVTVETASYEWLESCFSEKG